MILARLIVTTSIFLLGNLISYAQSSDTLKSTVISFKETSHDFGSIRQGMDVQYTFKFTNLGSSVLKIKAAACGDGNITTQCTKEPIMPGENGDITITFHSKGLQGLQNRTITVFSNATQSRVKLYIKAVVFH
jgi:hypothetical protein